MTKTIHAVYENGVFRPTETVDLPDRCEVEVEVCRVAEQAKKPSLDEVYAILSKRFDSGEHDIAARHNEHCRKEVGECKIRQSRPASGSGC